MKVHMNGELVVWTICKFLSSTTIQPYSHDPTANREGSLGGIIIIEWPPFWN